MKRKRLILNLGSLIITSVLLLSGCTNEIEGEPQTSNLLEELQKPFQTFTLEGDSLVTIKGKEGTMITINPDVFCYEDGSEVKEKITLNLSEFYRAGDMLLNSLSTQTNESKILATKGMINLTAFANGKKLNLKEGKSYEVGFPINEKEKETGYYFFEGKFDDNSNCVEWNEEFLEEKYKHIEFINGNPVLGDSLVPEMLIRNYKKSLDYYLFDSYKLGWMNCDKYPQFEEMKNKLLVNLGINDAHVRMIFKNFKGIKASENTEDGTKAGFYALTINQPVTLFGYSKVGDKIYLGQKDVILAENMEVDLEFKEVTIDELKEAANALEWKNV